jgi:hypothetical protein
VARLRDTPAQALAHVAHGPAHEHATAAAERARQHVLSCAHPGHPRPPPPLHTPAPHLEAERHELLREPRPHQLLLAQRAHAHAGRDERHVGGHGRARRLCAGGAASRVHEAGHEGLGHLDEGH